MLCIKPAFPEVAVKASKRKPAHLRRIDYNAVRFEEQVRNVDVALNTVDEATARRSLATLQPSGVMVTVAGAVPTDQCQTAQVRCGSPDRKTGVPIGQLLAEVGKLADAGKFAINVDAQFPLDKAADAWALSKAGHTRGKIVLIPPP